MHQHNQHRQLSSSEEQIAELNQDYVLNINGTICAVRVESDSFCWWPIDLRRRSTKTGPNDGTTATSETRKDSKRFRQYQRLQHHKRLNLSRILNIKLIPNETDDHIHQNAARKAGDYKQVTKDSENKDDNNTIKQKKLSVNKTTTKTTGAETKLVIYYAKSNEHRSNFKLLKLRELTIRILDPKRQKPLMPKWRRNSDVLVRSEVDGEKKTVENSNSNIADIQQQQQQFSALIELYEQLQNSLQACRQVRPKRLLIFLNPFGGKGKALRLYKRRVKRLLELADIERKLIITKYANHARETIEDPLFNVEYYDGIISVGGDGMFAELMNGLLFRYNRSKILTAELKKLECASTTTTDDSDTGGSSKVNRVISDWRKQLGGIGQPFLTPPIPLGMIGAGSTDANSFGFYGTNDVTTSTLNILLGNQIQIDICSVHSYETDRMLKFVSTFIAYGYFGDIIRESERLRWLGPSRYEVTALNILLRMRTYKGLVRLLVSDTDGTPHDSDIWCHNNCHLCQMNRTSAALSTAASSTISSNGNNDLTAQHQQKLHRSSTGISDATTNNRASTILYESGLGSNESILDGTGSASSSSDECISGHLCLTATTTTISYPELNKQQHDCDRTDDIRKDYRELQHQQTKKTTNLYNDQITQHSMTMLDEKHDNNDKDEISKFRLIEREGAFTGVNAAIMACRCSQTWKGFSPGNHLGNGCADLILIRQCSRAQYINYLLRTGMSKKSAFDLEYVDAFRCRQFEFISEGENEVNNLKDQQKNRIVEYKSASLSSSTESERITNGSGSSTSSASSGNGTGNSNVLDMISASHMNGLDTSKHIWNDTLASTVSSTALSSSSSNGVAGPISDRADKTIGSAERSSIGQYSEIDKQFVDVDCDTTTKLGHCNRSNRRKECSSWNIDGEILEEQSIRVKVNKQLLIVFGTGEPQRAAY